MKSDIELLKKIYFNLSISSDLTKELLKNVSLEIQNDYNDTYKTSLKNKLDKINYFLNCSQYNSETKDGLRVWMADFLSFDVNPLFENVGFLNNKTKNNSFMIIDDNYSSFLYNVFEDKDKLIDYSYDEQSELFNSSCIEVLYEFYQEYEKLLVSGTKEEILKFEEENEEILKLFRDKFYHYDLVSYSGKFSETTDFQNLYMVEISNCITQLEKYKEDIEGCTIKELMYKYEYGNVFIEKMQFLYIHGYGDIKITEVVRDGYGFSAVVLEDVDGNYMVNYNSTEAEGDNGLNDKIYDGSLYLNSIMKRLGLDNLSSILLSLKNTQDDLNGVLPIDLNVDIVDYQQEKAKELTNKYLQEANSKDKSVNFFGYSLGGSLAETSYLQAIETISSNSDDLMYFDNLGNLITYNGLHADLSESEVETLKVMGQDKVKFYACEGDFVSGYCNFEDFKDFTMYISPYETINIEDDFATDNDIKNAFANKLKLCKNSFLLDQICELKELTESERIYLENLAGDIDEVGNQELINILCDLYLNLYSKEELVDIYYNFELYNFFEAQKQSILNGKSEPFLNLSDEILGILSDPNFKDVVVDIDESLLLFLNENQSFVHLLFMYGYHSLEPAIGSHNKNVIKSNFDSNGMYVKKDQRALSPDELIEIAFGYEDITHKIDVAVEDLNNKPFTKALDQALSFWNNNKDKINNMIKLFNGNNADKKNALDLLDKKFADEFFGLLKSLANVTNNDFLDDKYLKNILKSKLGDEKLTDVVVDFLKNKNPEDINIDSVGQVLEAFVKKYVGAGDFVDGLITQHIKNEMTDSDWSCATGALLTVGANALDFWDWISN